MKAPDADQPDARPTSLKGGHSFSESHPKFVFANLGAFRVITTTKAGGNMAVTFGDPSEVRSRRAQVLRSAGVDTERLAFLDPTHSANIALAELEHGKTELRRFDYKPIVSHESERCTTAIDGVVTFEPNLPVGLLTGDCIPLALVHPETGLHGLIHIGLQGLLNGIIDNLSSVLEQLGVERAGVVMHLGPSISATSYDLSQSVLWQNISEQAKVVTPWIFQFVTRRGDSLFLDLPGAATARLHETGFTESSISRSNECTARDDSRFFSHYYARRNGKPNGRFMTVITAM